jgi:hypothetical protein
MNRNVFRQVLAALLRGGRRDLAHRLLVYAMPLETAKQLLGFNLKDSPSPTEIKKAWKKLAIKHHPDHGGSVQMMQQLNVAHDVLLGKQRATGPRPSRSPQPPGNPAWWNAWQREREKQPPKPPPPPPPPKREPRAPEIWVRAGKKRPFSQFKLPYDVDVIVNYMETFNREPVKTVTFALNLQTLMKLWGTSFLKDVYGMTVGGIRNISTPKNLKQLRSAITNMPRELTEAIDWRLEKKKKKKKKQP